MKKKIPICVFWLFIYLSVNSQTTSDLDLFYKLDEISGTTAEDIHGSLDGIIGNNVTINQSGKLGKSFLFSQGFSGSLITLPESSNLEFENSSFSVTMWVYPLNFSSSWKGLLGGETGAFVFGTYGNSGTLYAAKNNIAGSPSSGLNLTANEWNFVGVSFNSSASTNNLTFYVNGSTSTVTFNYDFDDGAISNLIGQISAGNNIWNGRIDEIGIWNKTLSASEVSNLFNSGNGLNYPFQSSKAVSSISVSPDSVTLLNGAIYQLSALISPFDADNKAIIWSSNSTEIATVNSVTGQLTANAPGTTVITASSVDGNKTDYSVVTVIDGSGLMSGLEEYYAFEETSGQLADSKGNNNSSSVTATRGVPGIIGNCLSFNGSLDKVSFYDHSNWTIGQTTNLSISAWISFNGDDAGEWGNIFGTASTYAFQVKKISAGNYQLIYWAGGSQLAASSTFSITPNTWYHVVMSKTGDTQVKFYKNNELIGTVDPVNLDGNPIANFIGGNESGEYFNGKIDELGIWKKALTSQEIGKLYNDGKGFGYLFKIIVAPDKLVEISESDLPSLKSTNSLTSEYGCFSWAYESPVFGETPDKFSLEGSLPPGIVSINNQTFEAIGFVYGDNTTICNPKNRNFDNCNFRVSAIKGESKSPSGNLIESPRGLKWSFDNTNLDESGYFEATIINNSNFYSTSTPTSQSLVSTHSVDLSGSGKYVNCGVINFNSTYQISGWCKLNDLTNNKSKRTIFSTMNDSKGFCGYYDPTLRKFFFEFNNGNNHDAAYTVEYTSSEEDNNLNNKWFHFEFEYYQYTNDVAIWINNVSKTEDSNLSIDFNITDSELILGMSNNDNYLGGFLDEVWIFPQYSTYAHDNFNNNRPPTVVPNSVVIKNNDYSAVGDIIYINGPIHGDYTYYDEDGDPENFNTNDGFVCWLIADDDQGRNERAVLYNSLNYTPRFSDDGKFIRFAICPHAQSGNREGLVYYSNYSRLEWSNDFPLSITNTTTQLNYWTTIPIGTLVTNSGKPFLVVGDSPWQIIVSTDLNGANEYLNDKQSKGINSIIVNLIDKNDVDNTEGRSPFSKLSSNSNYYDFLNRNDEYFSHAHDVIKAAEARGIEVFLFPAYLGYDNPNNPNHPEGWFSDIVENRNNKDNDDKLAIYNYGKYLGQTFNDCKNIIWVLGGDCAPKDQFNVDVHDDLVELKNGIVAGSTITPLFTVHNGRNVSGVTAWPTDNWINLNTTYSNIDNTNNINNTAKLLNDDYSRSMPFIFMEGVYKGDDDTRKPTEANLRSQMFLPVLMGAQGYFYGHHPYYSFSDGWNDSEVLNSQSTMDLERSSNFFNSFDDIVPWFNLIPDPTIVETESRGNINDGSYVAAARADIEVGQLIPKRVTVIYLPSSHEISLDPSKLCVGGIKTVKWYKPSTGDWFPRKENENNVLFSPPENTGDWLLLIIGYGIPEKSTEESGNINVEDDIIQDNFIFPNPAYDKLNIKNTIITGSSALIFDLQGRLIMNELITGSSIDISKLSRGTYVIKIINNDSVYINKFIKE
jgi:hypothetical protein